MVDFDKPIADVEDFKARLSQQGPFTQSQIEDGCRLWSSLPPDSKVSPAAINTIAQILQSGGDISQKKISAITPPDLDDLALPEKPTFEEFSKVLKEQGISDWTIEKLQIYWGNHNRPLHPYEIQDLVKLCQRLVRAESGEYTLDNLLAMLQDDMQLSDEHLQAIKKSVCPEPSSIFGGMKALFHDVFARETAPLTRKQIDQVILLAKAFKTGLDFADYDDFQGVRREHLVIHETTPLPAPYESSSEHMKILDNLDYRIDLSESDIAAILDENGKAVKEIHETSVMPAKELAACQQSILDGETSLEPSISSYNEQNTGIADSKGWTHPTMEDRHLISEFSIDVDGEIKKVSLTALFDGHGGDECSDFAKNNFLKKFQHRLNTPPLNQLSKEVRIYNALQLALVDVSRSYTGAHQGSTANVCLRIDNELWVANLGDSRALLVTPSETIPLSKDQKPNMPEIREFIEARGGKIMHTPSGFVISHPLSHYVIYPGRGLGDHLLQGGMFSRPIITKYTLEKPCYLIQVCDGVTDVLTTKEIGDFTNRLQNKSPDQIATAITDLALKCQSGDNITTLVTPV